MANNISRMGIGPHAPFPKLPNFYHMTGRDIMRTLHTRINDQMMLDELWGGSAITSVSPILDIPAKHEATMNE